MSPLLLPRRLLFTQTDERLVTLAAAGHDRAFEVLVERYRTELLRYCRRLLLPEARAEDVLQQAWMSAWQVLSKGAEVREPRAWLYRIVHNQAISALRKSGYDYDELSESLRGADAPEEDLERRAAVREALAGLASLPALQREVLLRTAVEGQSHEQVAHALGLSNGAVRGMVYRARAAMRTAATAVTPPSLAAWAASAGGSTAPLGQRLAESIGVGSAGVTGVLVKTGAIALTAGGLVTGGVLVHRSHHSDRATARSAAVTQAAEKEPLGVPGPAGSSHALLGPSQSGPWGSPEGGDGTSSGRHGGRAGRELGLGRLAGGREHRLYAGGGGAGGPSHPARSPGEFGVGAGGGHDGHGGGHDGQAGGGGEHLAAGHDLSGTSSGSGDGGSSGGRDSSGGGAAGGSDSPERSSGSSGSSSDGGSASSAQGGSSGPISGGSGDDSSHAGGSGPSLSSSGGGSGSSDGGSGGGGSGGALNLSSGSSGGGAPPSSDRSVSPATGSAGH